MPRGPNPLKALSTFFEQSRALIALFDAEQRLIYINPAAAQWFGKEAAELIGQKAIYSSTSTPASPIAGISPPPDAFAGKLCTGSIVPSGIDERGWDRMAVFLPLVLAEQEEAAVLMIADHETGLTYCALGNQLVDKTWHGALQLMRKEVPAELRNEYLLGISPAMRRVREQVQLAGATNAATMLVSQAGCGGEHIIRNIQSLRKLASVNVLTIDCALHDAASFFPMLQTFHFREEQSTVWLKDVDQLPLAVQSQLLSVLHICTTHALLSTASQSLAKAVRKKRFSAELAARLSTITITVPPLKSRAQDIPLLAQWCVEQYNATASRALNGVLPAAIEHLAAYRWPGNVDEFVATMAAACANAKGLWVTVADLPERLHTAWDDLVHPRRAEETIQLDTFLAEIETEILRRSLAQARGNKSKAAQLLGISRPRLLRRLVQLGIVAAEEEKIDFQPLDDGDKP